MCKKLPKWCHKQFCIYLQYRGSASSKDIKKYSTAYRLQVGKVLVFLYLIYMLPVENLHNRVSEYQHNDIKQMM